MATVGSLVLELRANAASFHQEMGRARTGLQQTGRSFSQAEHTAASFAAKGLGSVIPAAEGFEFSIQKVIASALRAGSAFRLLGLAGVGAGLGIAAVAVTKKIAEFAALGETLDAYKARLEKAAEAQDKLFDKLRTGIQMNVALGREAARARGGASVLGFELAGDDEGAIRRRRQDSLDDIQAEAQDRAAAARQQVLDRKLSAEQLASTLIQVEQWAAAERQRINARAAKEYAALDKDRLEKETTSWAEGTQRFMAEIRRRVQAKKDFEESLTPAFQGIGLQGSAWEGLQAVKKLEEETKRAAQGIAFMEQTGTPPRDLIFERQRAQFSFEDTARKIRESFGGLPAVMDALDQAMGRLHWGDFFTLVETAKTSVTGFAQAANFATGGLNAIGQSLVNLPSGVDAASAAVRRLRDDFGELTRYVWGAIGAIQVLDQVTSDAAQ